MRVNNAPSIIESVLFCKTIGQSSDLRTFVGVFAVFLSGNVVLWREDTKKNRTEQGKRVKTTFFTLLWWIFG